MLARVKKYMYMTNESNLLLQDCPRLIGQVTVSCLAHPHSLNFSRTKLNINLTSLGTPVIFPVLTCPTLWTELILQSELSKPIASGLGYSPSSSTYMLSVNCGPSNATQLQAQTCTEKCIIILKHYPILLIILRKVLLDFL